MIFVVGHRLFGRVDEVPGHFFVATEFYHFDYVPILPLQTWIVTSTDGRSWNGIKVPHCRKSIATAWAVGAAALTMVFAGMTALAQALSYRDATSAVIAFAAGGVAFLFARYYPGITHCDLERACELAAMANIRGDRLNKIRALYGAEPLAAGAAERKGTAGAPGTSDPAPESAVTFFIDGTDARTGQEVCLTIHAADAESARQLATQRGVHVREVEHGGGA